MIVESHIPDAPHPLLLPIESPLSVSLPPIASNPSARLASISAARLENPKSCSFQGSKPSPLLTRSRPLPDPLTRSLPATASAHWPPTASADWPIIMLCLHTLLSAHTSHLKSSIVVSNDPPLPTTLRRSGTSLSQEEVALSSALLSFFWS